MPLTGGLILVATADDDAYASLELALAGEARTVRRASSGASALHDADHHRPDLILLDLVLGDMDGVAVLHSLAADESTRGIPVMMLAEDATAQTILDCLALGAVDYVLKSSVGPDLLVRAQRHLRLAGVSALHTSIINGLGSGIAVQDADLRIVEVNPAAERLLGLTADQLSGRTSLDPRWRAVHEDGTDFPGEGHPAVVALHTGQAVHDVVMGIHKPTGELTWLIVSAEVIRDASGGGAVRGVVVFFTDITGEVGVRATAAASEERYRLLAENASDVVFAHDGLGHVTWVSPSITATLGWTPDEVTALPLSSLVHADDHAFEEADLSGGRPSRFRHKDGTYSWMSWKTATLHREDGEVVSAVTSMHNVEELVQARDVAESESARRAAIVESLLDPHVLMQAVRDDDGVIVDFVYADANDSACEYNRTPREQLIGMRLLDLLPGQAGSGMLALYADAVDSEKPLILNDYAYPHEILGEERRFDIRAVRVGDALSFTWRDVTERYDAQVLLESSEYRFRNLAEQASDVVIEISRGLMKWVSPALTTMLGWEPGQWVGHRLLEFVHAEDRLTAQQGLEETRTGVVSAIRVRVRSSDGGHRWVEIHVGIVTDPDGAREAVVVTFRTIDEEIGYQRELERRATIDDLTGALKRDPALRRLQEVGHRVRSPGVETGVLFIDVDDFKVVNDTWGHAAGDALLKSHVERIRGNVRAGDAVARMGGDEFLVTLEGIHDLHEAVTVAEAIRRACAEPVTTHDGAITITITTTVSIGVTLAHPIESGDELVARADKAMYAAKRSGRNQVVAVLPPSGESTSSPR